MAERHDSTTEQGCFEAGREVGEWVGGGGQQRWQQSGGWWDFQGAVQVQVQDVDGRGWCSGSTCLGLDWAGTGLDGDWDWRQQSCQGTTGRARRDGDKIGGDPLWQGRGRCGAAAQRGCSKKGDGMGKAKPKADARMADDCPIEYVASGAGGLLFWLAG